MSRRLLILACSQRKRPDEGLLPAVERYDGPAFRVLRKFLRTNAPEAANLDIFVLSAEFALITYDQPIPYYDRKMTTQRASEIRSSVLAELRQLFEEREFRQLLISAGKTYLGSIQGYEELLPKNLEACVSSGTQGSKLSTLYSWLYQHAPASGPARRITPVGKARIRGIELMLSPEQILDVARRSLAEGHGDPTNYHSWYVEVDGQRVAPKWLVSQLTGLAVSEFQSKDARSLLQRLGVQLICI